MTRFALTTALLLTALTASLTAQAATVVRDQVTIKLSGQTRHLKLCSDNAKVATVDQPGRPEGKCLVGDFYLKLVKPDGSLCGSLSLGRLSIDKGEGYDDLKVLLLGDYNGDGRKLEVALRVARECSNSWQWAVAEVSAKTGRLLRWRFANSDGASETVSARGDSDSLSHRAGHFRARGYDNSFSVSDTGWYEDLYKWDAKRGLWRFVKTVGVEEPPSGEWPRM